VYTPVVAVERVRRPTVNSPDDVQAGELVALTGLGMTRPVAKSGRRVRTFCRRTRRVPGSDALALGDAHSRVRPSDSLATKPEEFEAKSNRNRSVPAVATVT
jgi:hypothetical protein